MCYLSKWRQPIFFFFKNNTKELVYKRNKIYFVSWKYIVYLFYDKLILAESSRGLSRR